MLLRRAFTLIELLVVIAIIAILAAILFPVFAQAKDAAKKTADLSNQKQNNLAVQMYLADADDFAPLWMYTGSFNVNNGDGSWGNIVFPYIKNDDMAKTPVSPFSVLNRKYDINFPTPTGATKEKQEKYNLGWLTDYGYNYQTYTGFIYDPAAPNGFRFTPISMTSLSQPANTILNITGIFDRDASGGLKDGGQLPIDPPCRRALSDGADLTANAGNSAYYYGGWQPGSPNAWNVFGGVWPYYTGGGQKAGARASVGFSDGHAKTFTIPQIAAGCNVQNSWGGRVFNEDVYMWAHR
jgi:prepilin-type N-terminal cleavage/methylation domain-containing protein